MASAFVQQLLGFVFSPAGLFALTFCCLSLLFSRSSRRTAWLLLALCIFFASLGAPGGEYILYTPPLVFPLEELRAAGRPLTILFLVTLLLIGFRQRRARPGMFPKPIVYILLVQVTIIAKTLLFGSASFALLTGVTVSSIVLMLWWGPASWLQNEADFRLAAWSVAFVAVIFLAVNSYQAAFDPYPLLFVQARFTGTTANAQHAATFLAATLPATLYMLELQSAPLPRFFWLAASIAVGILLVLTGSRTGMAMALTTLLFFYGGRPASLVRLTALLALLAGVFLLLAGAFSIDWWSLFVPLQDRYTNIQNTRAGVWDSLWRNFQTNPLWGAPLQADRLMGYGESSWLGAASSLGLAGILPLLLAGVESLRMAVGLLLQSRRNPANRLAAHLVIAGLATLLVGSIFEAYLLGNLSASVLLLFVYMIMGQYLLVRQRDLHQPSTVHWQPNRGSQLYAR